MATAGLEIITLNDSIRVVDEEDRYLAEIPEERLQAVFAAPEGLTPIVNAIEHLARDFAPDITSAKGRAAIKSMAHKITRSKTYLDGLGKQLVDDLKELPKRIDATRKEMRDRLDTLATEVRQPLTVWEEHTKALSDRLNWIDGLPSTLANATSDEIEEAYSKTVIFEPVSEEAWESFTDEAKLIIPRTNRALLEMIKAKKRAEADTAELELLRKAAAERERKDAEEKRIREAAEAARKEAEERTERERQAALGREAEAKRQAELAEQRLAEAKRLSEERDREYQRQREEQERIAAELAEQARVQAIESERQRQAEAERIAAEQKAAREADQGHRKQVNSEVAEDIEAVIADARSNRDIARAVVIAIIKGQIRHTTITY